MCMLRTYGTPLSDYAMTISLPETRCTVSLYTLLARPVSAAKVVYLHNVK
jgi:hypothetical protein